MICLTSSPVWWIISLVGSISTRKPPPQLYTPEMTQGVTQASREPGDLGNRCGQEWSGRECGDAKGNAMIFTVWFYKSCFFNYCMVIMLNDEMVNKHYGYFCLTMFIFHLPFIFIQLANKYLIGQLYGSNLKLLVIYNSCLTALF